MGSSAFVALAVDREWMDFESVGYAAMGILITAGFLCGRGGKKESGVVHGILSAAIYVGLLLAINLLLFGGTFESVLLCIGLLLLGVLIRTGIARSGDRRKRTYKIPKI